MKIFLLSLFGALCLFVSCQRQDLLDHPTSPGQQETVVTDRTDGEDDGYSNYVTYTTEGSSQECCTAQFCKFITTSLGNNLCGHDFTSTPLITNSFAFLIHTPNSTNSTVKTRYRIKLEKMGPAPLPGQIQSITTVFDLTTGSSFPPPCQERLISITPPSFTVDCNARYRITFQVIDASSGNPVVCTTLVTNNVNLCATDE